MRETSQVGKNSRSRPGRPLFAGITVKGYKICHIFREIINSTKVTKQKLWIKIQSSGQFSCSVMSTSLWPCELQHTRPPCPLPTPGIHPNPYPLSWWCHPTIYLILCCPLLHPPSSFPIIRVFSNQSVIHIRWTKYWSFGFGISPSNEYSGLISFRMDWLDLLAVQGTLKSILQHQSSKATILWHSAFFTVQFSHPYMATGKTIALTRRTLVRKVMSLLFNMMSRLVIAFLPRSKRLGMKL